MAQDNFIEIDGRFIEPVRSKHSLQYRGTAAHKSVSTEGPLKFNRFLIIKNPKDPNSFTGLSIQNNDYSISSDHVKYTIDTENSTERRALFFSNIYYILNFIDVFQKNNNQLRLVDNAKLEQISDNFLVLHKKKVQFYKDYGDFTISNKRTLLTDEALPQINKIFVNLDKYETDKNLINEAIKKEITALNNLITPFLLEEQYNSDMYGRARREYAVELPVKTLGSLIPLITLNNVQKEMLTLFRDLRKTHNNIYDLSKSVEEQNAQSQLQGYALYFNDPSSHSQGQGFYSNNGLRPSILEARIFLTSEQAKTYAQKNCGSHFIVVELDFRFSKIVEQKDCTPGSMITSLIARKEAQELNDKLKPLESVGATEEKKPKAKHKI